MKLMIEKKTTVIIVSSLKGWPWGLSIFLISFIAAMIPAAVIIGTNTITPAKILTLMLIIALIPTAIYYIIRAFDAYLYVKSSSLEYDKNIISGTFGGFKRMNISIPTSQISNMFVGQSLFERIFSVCSLIIIHENITTRAFGFNYDNATKFIRELSEKYKVPVNIQK